MPTVLRLGAWKKPHWSQWTCPVITVIQRKNHLEVEIVKSTAPANARSPNGRSGPHAFPYVDTY